ncbi:MAG: glutaminyl-peptide cyclotransferase [Myxococcota bacterium]
MNEKQSTSAVLVQELGPFAGKPVHGVTHDGEHLWVAAGAELRAVDTDRNEVVRELPVSADAGTAFDGTHLYQLAGEHIQKLDARSGDVVANIPAPGKGRDSGMTWAEGTLWVGQHRDRKIHQIDPDTGAILKTIESDRFVTGVTWTDGQLWHATWEGDASDLRRIDPVSGAVLERYDAPEGTGIAGLCRHGQRFYCGAGPEGKVRAVVIPDATR